MAHGFRYVPQLRTVSPPEPPRCPRCHARLDIGMLPHLCKEVTYGTAVMPTRMIPLDAEEEGGCPHPGVGCDDADCPCTCGNCSVFGEW